jgi:hypothetical protein
MVASDGVVLVSEAPRIRFVTEINYCRIGNHGR